MGFLCANFFLVCLRADVNACCAVMNIPIGLVALVAIYIVNLPVPNVSGRAVFMKELKKIDLM